jgi:hypothetical protein
VTVPLPAVPETLLAVTAPPNSETEASVTLVLLHVAPLAAKEPKATSGVAVGYAEGPRVDAGVPNAHGERPGSSINAAPAPTQLVGR